MYDVELIKIRFLKHLFEEINTAILIKNVLIVSFINDFNSEILLFINSISIPNPPTLITPSIAADERRQIDVMHHS